MMMSLFFDKMLFEQEDFIYSAMDEFYWDNEVYEMMEIGVSGSGWLSADDPVFWCVAPAYLEEIVWLFRTAPTRQPYDASKLPLTLLEYYLRMDLSDLLDKLLLAPKKIHDALCMIWARVTKRRKLSTENRLNQSSKPELRWLFEQDPANL
ncbi:hypothetical protein CsmBV32.6 [Diolcogaster facetosa bracovirus]|uniref:Uncharacterized protein n=3 Tax=Bracoviriform TaxID=2946836 RepID=R9XNF5_9VIRU|nr:hypothetical protein CsmBV32.6 [Diolcogaster facetosa bracovirus] [Bracoviriform facetosae]AGO14370.1 hypothetical protein CsmBV32.6 [Diolcogaster facetosa bracovirus] [Bracoviriform facetosae]AGO14444.1 hypothetical protein CsmBV32.6 [Cotesia sesamiae Mombasa bracovirus]CCQ19248.1 hypothetical protein CSKBV_32.6 [Cotesia sesamiae Kitale bracovirus]